MTKLEERLNDAACKNSPYKICACKEPDEGSCDNCKSIFDFKAGARFILELPELKALVEALKTVDAMPCLFPYPEISRAQTTAADALSQWRSFTGEGDNEANS